jgi:type VI secretion system secreted protein VgrG
MTSLSSRLDGNKRFDFLSQGYDASTFSVVRLQGREALSELFRFELILVSDDAKVDLDKMLQNTATLNILAPADPSNVTPYSGMLAEFAQLHQAGGYTFYRAVLVPRMWRLRQIHTSEIYLNEQTIPQIISGVLGEVQLSGSSVDLRLAGEFRPRSFVCQYQETHFQFVSRWLEKEGVYYYFAQTGSEDVLTLVDDRAMHDANALPVSYRPYDELDVGIASDSIQSFSCEVRPLPAKCAVQDYNYRRASVPLSVEVPVASNGLGESMYYGDNFRDADEGRRYANLRAQTLLCTGKVFAGEATAVGMRSGYFIELTHHYRSDFDGRYLVTEIMHEGSQAGVLLAGLRTPFSEHDARDGETVYRNAFKAIPASVQYRAPRVTPRPYIAGLLNATIDAEGSGQYAELDAYGQYLVQVPFDRTDKSAAKGSTRVRMMTPYSGEGHGMHFPLIKNAEVLIAFIDGDPDQPVIAGAIPNSVNSSVVSDDNPAQNRIVTHGGNQVRFSDTAGKQSVWIYSPGANTHLYLGSGS